VGDIRRAGPLIASAGGTSFVWRRERPARTFAEYATKAQRREGN
jgi:hypothetical protein